MIKVAIMLLCIASMALCDGEVEEIEVNERGCPVDNMIYKILPHESCNKFYKCSNGKPYEFECPPPLVFSLTENVCDWAFNVDCGDRLGTSSTTLAPTTESDSDDPAIVCAKDGSHGLLLPHQYCDRLYMCAAGRAIEITCPIPLLFNVESRLCEWENQVDCGDRILPTREETTTTTATTSLEVKTEPQEKK